MTLSRARSPTLSPVPGLYRPQRRRVQPTDEGFTIGVPGRTG